MRAINLTLKQILLFDESGIILASYPSHEKFNVIGGLLSAINTIAKELSNTVVRVIDAGDFRFYTEKTREGILFVLAVQPSEEWFKFDESIDWFVKELETELEDVLKSSVTQFGFDLSESINPTLKEFIDLYNAVAEKLINLSKIYGVGKQILGKQADELLKQCETMGIRLKVRDGYIFIDELYAKLEKAPEILNQCETNIKKFLKSAL